MHGYLPPPPPPPPPPLALSLPYLLSFLSSLLPSLLSHSSFISLCLFLSATNCLNSGSKNANLSPIHAWVSPSLPLAYPLFSLSSLPPSLLSHSLLSLSVSLENICKHYNKLTKIKIQKCKLVTNTCMGISFPPSLFPPSLPPPSLPPSLPPPSYRIGGRKTERRLMCYFSGYISQYLTLG